MENFFYGETEEVVRIYHYPNGTTFSVRNVVGVYIKKSNPKSHRVVSEDGMTYYPSSDWVGISWKQKNGKPFDY